MKTGHEEPEAWGGGGGGLGEGGCGERILNIFIEIGMQHLSHLTESTTKEWG